MSHSNRGRRGLIGKLIASLIGCWLLVLPQTFAQCKTLEDCQEAIALLQKLLVVRGDQVDSLKAQSEILEKQNVQLRELRDGAIKNLDGIREAVAMMQRDNTSRFLRIQADSRERFEDLRHEIRRPEPAWIQGVTWATRVAAFVAAIRHR